MKLHEADPTVTGASSDRGEGPSGLITSPPRKKNRWVLVRDASLGKTAEMDTTKSNDRPLDGLKMIRQPKWRPKGGREFKTNAERELRRQEEVNEIGTHTEEETAHPSTAQHPPSTESDKGGASDEQD